MASSNNRPPPEEARFPVVEERLSVGKRSRPGRRVRIRLNVTSRSAPYEIDVAHGAAEITRVRVPDHAPLERPPAVRVENGVTIIPIVDEVAVMTPRYVVREEIHVKTQTRTERATGEIVLRQTLVELDELPPRDPEAYERRVPPMTRTLAAVYDDSTSAERARQLLISAGVADSAISLIDQGGSHKKRGFFASLFGGHDDSAAYEESLRRGGTLLTAHVDDALADEAIRVIEASDPVDLDTREGEWRGSGWDPSQERSGEMLGEVRAEAGQSTGRSDGRGRSEVTTTGTTRTGASDAAAIGDAEVLPVIEERLRVGKREVARGGVRVRSYVVETPVEEFVTLRQQYVDVERRPVNAPLTPGDAQAAFQDRDIVVEEIVEEPVVSKEAVVAEEVVVRRREDQRTETVRDTTRRTEVEVDRDAPLSDKMAGGKSGGGTTGGQAH